jgi:superfamily II DNA or RNA helicase
MSRRQLYDHQDRALRKLPANGGYLAFEQGLGKTLTAIAYAKQWGYHTVVVVAPAVAVSVWERELDEEGITAVVPTGTRKQKATQLAPRMGWTVLNYEATLEPAVEQRLKKVLRPSGTLLILDEAHKVKNSSARRSRVAHRLGREASALLLSGTPITRNLLDLYSQYKVIDPDIWGGLSWTKFRLHYGVWGGYGNYQLVGYHDTDALKEKIAPWTVVARKEDTLDLPLKTFQTVPVAFSTESWKQYSLMMKEGANDEWVTTNPLEKALRLAQISGRAKVEATYQLAREFREMGTQTVIYARFLDELAALSEALDVPALTGSTSMADRAIMVEQFQSGELDIFLSQIQAGSVGITLTAASHMIYHSLSFAYEDFAQSQDRIHRIGQDQPCTYYYMTTVGPRKGITIDGTVLNALSNKEDVAAMITADPTLLLMEDE